MGLINSDKEYIVKIGRVVSNIDSTDGFTIKVRINGEDDGISDNDLQSAFPLLPKMLHVLPKIGEAVMVFSSRISTPYGQRFYVGPLIHQPQFMNFDEFNGALSLMDGGSSKFILPALSRNPDAKGVMPKNDEIALLGRGNTDLTLNENEVKVRCGVKLADKNDKQKILFNKTNPTYLKLKLHDNTFKDETNSTATIVAENVNLLSSASKQYFKLNETDDLISDETMKEIIENAHVLPYGDILVNFLNIFKKAFNSHTHAYSGLPPVQDINYTNLNSFNMKDMLSEHVRIN